MCVWLVAWPELSVLFAGELSALGGRGGIRGDRSRSRTDHAIGRWRQGGGPSQNRMFTLLLNAADRRLGHAKR